MPGPAIYMEHLRKVFGSRIAVADLTLQVERGEVFGFLGPNGAGKTTTVKMMTGLIRPTSGRISILGRPLGDMAARRRIGFLPEQFRFHEWLRADEFLDFHGALYGLTSDERRRRIPEVLGLVGLEGRATSRLQTFSKGMLQRIGIAQALIAEPELVFLDEPTSALDPIGRREVRGIIRQLQGQEVSIFLNSHLLTEVEQVCNRAAIIKDGVVVAMGPLDELLGGTHVVEVRAEISPELLKAAVPRYNIVEENPSRQPVAIDGNKGTLYLASLADEEVPALVDFLTQGGARIYAIMPRQRSLEELFVDVVQAGGDR